MRPSHSKTNLFLRTVWSAYAVLVFFFLLATEDSLTAQVQSGAYTGNGVDNRAITGVGFQPDVIILKAATAQTAVIRTSTMTGDATKPMVGATALQANRIQSLDADGFTVGTDASVNSSGVAYYWVAFRAKSGRMKVGTYTGNSSSSNTITGVGFSPELVYFMSATNNNMVMHSTASLLTYQFDANSGNSIVDSLNSDGFTVGSDPRANGNGITYHYVAWTTVPGELVVSNYTGNGADPVSIAGLGFQPECVIVKAAATYAGVFHSQAIGVTTDSSQYFTATANASNEIRALQSGGFQVGSGQEVNQPGVIYCYLGWKQILLPTQLAITAVNGGASPTAGTGFSVVVQSQDPTGTAATVVSNTAVSLSLNTGGGTLAGTLTGTIVAGSNSVTITGVTYTKAEGGVILAAARTSGDNLTAGTSAAFTVTAGAFAKLQLLMPGETAAPGSASGKTGSPTAQTAGSAFTVTVNAVDANWNLVSSTHTIGIASSDGNAALPANAALVAGAKTYSVTLKTAGSWTVTATDVSDGTKTANTSPATTVTAGAFAKLQLLMPGETAAPGSASGKTGSPTAQTVATAFSVTVNSVDGAWNPISTNDMVAITSNDTNAVLPGNAALSAGTQTFSLTWRTAGSATATASDVTHPAMTANTSPATTVNPGNQTITFPSPGNQTYGVAPFTLGATASSGLAVTYSVTSGPATALSNTLTITGAGSVTLQAAQNGNANWNAAAPVSQTISISQKSVTASITASNKVYDGATNAGIATRGLTGVTNSDVATLTGGVAAFADKVVANNKTITATGLTLSGSNAGNYVLVSSTATTTANITARALTVTATGVNKSYDGGPAATAILSDNRVSGDTLTTSCAAAAFIDKNVGSGKTVNVTGIGVTGADAGNYTFNATAIATANITTANLAVSANNTNRVYGAANPAFQASFSGFVGADTATVVSGAPGFSTTATTASPVGVYPITPNSGNLSASNYAFSVYNNGALTISAASSAMAVGSSANPSSTGSNVTFTATLTAVAPGAGVLTGAVQFRVDGVALGLPASLAGASASIASSALSHGVHAVSAEYAGDGNFAGSTNSLGSSEVINASPTTAPVALQRMSTVGDKVRATTLLACGHDSDNDALALSSVASSSAAGGFVSSVGKWFHYAPPAGYTNADSFSFVIADAYGAQSSGAVSISIQSDTNQSQNQTSITTANGSSIVRFQGVPCRAYTIQFTESLSTPSWQSLGSSTADALGQFQFTDTPATNSPLRYYRSTYP